MSTLESRLRLAISDPGAVAGRRLHPSWGPGHDGYAEQPETIQDWQWRAVITVLSSPGGVLDQIERLTDALAPAASLPQVRLAQVLTAIEAHDVDYPTRYGLVLEAMHLAREAGYDAAYGYDEKGIEGLRIVAYIDLPTGQVSWHMPEYPAPFDGHDTPTKYARCRAYAAEAGA